MKKENLNIIDKDSDNLKEDFDIIEEDQAKKGSKLKRWFKRIGLAGFLFFLIKGIVWLFIFYGAGSLIAC